MEEIGAWIQKLNRQIRRRIDESVAGEEVTGVQCGMIRYLYNESKKHDVFAKDLENEFDMRRASVAGIIQLMEKNGLIRREEIDQDGRCKKIVLTDKALQIREIIEQEIGSAEKQLVQDMDKEQIETILAGIKQMSYNMNRKKEENKR